MCSMRGGDRGRGHVLNFDHDTHTHTHSLTHTLTHTPQAGRPLEPGWKSNKEAVLKKELQKKIAEQEAARARKVDEEKKEKKKKK
jgi:hypothetical protein